MAINLAAKYSDKIASMYTVGSLVADKTSKEWDFSGVKTIKIYTPQTVEPVDYTRSGSNRFGTPVEMADTVQELTMSQDKSYSIIIDKGNNNEQMLVKNAGKMLKLQTNEKVVPMVDKYALSRYCSLAGTIAGIEKPTKATIIADIGEACKVLDDACVPQENRYLYVTGEIYSLIRQSSEFLGLESLGTKALAKGIVGDVFGAKIVKVPSSYLPSDVYFLLTHKDAVILPYKIRDAKVHQDPPGISGALLEGRNNYDAFVIGARCMGVYAAVASSALTEEPTITISDSTATISAGEGCDIYFTIDDTDPRYSENTEKYSSAVSVLPGQTIRAYAVNANKFTSSVAQATA